MKPDRELMLLLTVALSEQVDGLRFRTIMKDQPERAVRREYDLAAEAVAGFAPGLKPPGFPSQRVASRGASKRR